MTTRHIENRLADIEKQLNAALAENDKMHHDLITAQGLVKKWADNSGRVQGQLAAIKDAVHSLREAIKEPA